MKEGTADMERKRDFPNLWYRLASISASLTLRLMFFHMYLVMLPPNRKQGLGPAVHTWQLRRCRRRALGSSLVKWHGSGPRLGEHCSRVPCKPWVCLHR